jgi:hypothetical protein
MAVALAANAKASVPKCIPPLNSILSNEPDLSGAGSFHLWMKKRISGFRKTGLR